MEIPDPAGADDECVFGSAWVRRRMYPRPDRRTSPTQVASDPKEQPGRRKVPGFAFSGVGHVAIFGRSA
jgi:hypothetical protein